LLLTILALALIPYVVNQVKKPTRRVGRLFLWIMNRSHSRLTDWGLGHLAIERLSRVLDVGCGGGRTIEKLATLAADGRVCGIDFSRGSVEASRSLNATRIEAGRVAIVQGSVSRLPFAERRFDLVTAVETHYYWPDLVADLSEIRRVLVPGGTLIVIAEAFRGSRHGWMQHPMMTLLRARFPGVDEMRASYRDAGFTAVETFVEEREGWMCAVGRTPS